MSALKSPMSQVLSNSSLCFSAPKCVWLLTSLLCHLCLGIKLSRQQNLPKFDTVSELE